jgi:uncharacterized protein YfiM (DUF2279 family)
MIKNKVLIILFLLLFSGKVFASDPQFFQKKEVTWNFQKNCWRQEDRWIAKDKLQHFSSSMMIFVTNYYYQDRYLELSEATVIVGSYTLSVSLGIGKEILDFAGPKRYFSLKDLIADIAGNIAGNVLVNNIK